MCSEPFTGDKLRTERYNTSYYDQSVATNTNVLVGVSLTSPTLAGLHCTHVRVCLFVCLWPYTTNFKPLFHKDQSM